MGVAAQVAAESVVVAQEAEAREEVATVAVVTVEERVEVEAEVEAMVEEWKEAEATALRR